MEARETVAATRLAKRGRVGAKKAGEEGKTVEERGDIVKKTRR